VSTVIKSSARSKVVKTQRTGRYDLEGIHQEENTSNMLSCNWSALVLTWTRTQPRSISHHQYNRVDRGVGGKWCGLWYWQPRTTLRLCYCSDFKERASFSGIVLSNILMTFTPTFHVSLCLQCLVVLCNIQMILMSRVSWSNEIV
jgi:hypothetical protein